MKSLIVPVNFSPCAYNAARYAAALALETGAELHLVHVVQILIPSTEMVMNEYLYRQMCEAGESGLTKMKADILQRTTGRVSVTTHIQTGAVADKVEEWYTALKADLIVMGVTGPTMQKFLSGSPEGSLLHLNLPLLVIPAEAHYEPLRRIVLACDDNDVHGKMRQSLPLLCELRDCYQAKVDLVAVETTSELNDEACCYPEEGSDSLGPLHALRHYAPQHSVEEGLEEFLQGGPGELAVVFPKKHSLLEFHRNRSRRSARHASTPVLSLPE